MGGTARDLMGSAGHGRSSGGILAGLGLLLAALVMPLILIRGKSITLDEVSHVAAGYSYLRTHEIVLNPMHPPLIKELCALPLSPRSQDARRRRDIPQAEAVTCSTNGGSERTSCARKRRSASSSTEPVAVLLSVGLATVILLWASELWGPGGGALALFLYVSTRPSPPMRSSSPPTCPLHSSRRCSCSGFAAPCARRLGDGWSSRGIGLGLALAAKFSAVILIPIAALLMALASFSMPRQAPDDSPLAFRLLLSSSYADRLLGAAGLFGVMALIGAMVVWAAYFFPSDLSFYVHGLSLVEADHAQRYYHFFRGEFSKGTWPSYFLIAWLVKTPLPELALLALSGVLFARGERAPWLEEAFLLVPLAVFFVGYASLAQPIGVRYVIPCYPFLYVFAGRAAVLLMRGLLSRLVLVGTLAWSVVEFAAIWPDHLPYFNQIAGGWRGGIHWLDDSNIDWGQGLLELRDYLAKRSIRDYTLCTAGNADIGEFYGMKGGVVWLDKLFKPPPGLLIMSSHCVARMTVFLEEEFGDGPQNWLVHVVPTDVVGHTYYVYEIPSGS